MVVLTLAGNSRRFFDKDYSVVKYKLPYKGDFIISQILKYIPKSENLVIVLNVKFNDYEFINQILKKNKFSNYKIIELKTTKGQLETVFKALNSLDFNQDEKLTVFNGDTIRKSKNWNDFEGDGCIEVFNGEGEHWSFIDNLYDVSYVIEKKRISNHCSSGLYFFKSIKIFLQNYSTYDTQKKELFVSEYYNHLIHLGLKIKGKLIDIEKLVFLGTPDEYEQVVKNEK